MILVGIVSAFMPLPNPGKDSFYDKNNPDENNPYENIKLYRKCAKINPELADSCADIDALDESKFEEARKCFLECLE